MPNRTLAKPNLPFKTFIRAKKLKYVQRFVSKYLVSKYIYIYIYR